MLVFPNAKINLGLYVTEKRPDGYHNLQTVFYPLNWCDALEVIEDSKAKEPFSLEISGLEVSGSLTDNLLYKAWKMLSEKHTLPKMRVYLHKVIPMGAGLGGGSADAAFFLNLLNTKFSLQLSTETLSNYASQLGSDCAFFLHNKALYAEGRGEIFTDISLNLNAYYILAIFPQLHSSTAAAFKELVPQQPKHNLIESISKPVNQWKDCLFNDFEQALFKLFPQLQQIKHQLYQSNALYAAMSGSGSTMFGIFETEPDVSMFNNYSYYLQKPGAKPL